MAFSFDLRHCRPNHFSCEAHSFAYSQFNASAALESRVNEAALHITMRETGSLSKARQKAESSTSDPQELNRVWWETLPMTYVDWDAPERKLQTIEQFAKAREEFRNCSQ